MSQPADTPPPLDIAAASADEYCRSLRAHRAAEMWWFLTGAAPYRGFSRPFQDRSGTWWWCAKPKFAWPLDLFTPWSQAPRFRFGTATLGCQHPVAEHEANSALHFNLIRDLRGYRMSHVASQKRRAIRKGLRSLALVPLELHDDKVVDEACEVWNSHVERTSWNSAFSAAEFREHWRPLATTAGTTVLGARRQSDGVLAAWVIARNIDGVVYVDTIASHTDRVAERPNDALIYTLLFNAARAGATAANYFLRSPIEPLEKFKQSLGFDSGGIPARLRVHPFVAPLLRRLKPSLWSRLVGDWPPPASEQPPSTSD